MVFLSHFKGFFLQAGKDLVRFTVQIGLGQQYIPVELLGAGRMPGDPPHHCLGYPQAERRRDRGSDNRVGGVSFTKPRDAIIPLQLIVF